MQNLLQDLVKLLEKDDRLVIEGQLFKNKVIELALALDSSLIRLLLSSEGIRRHFFQDVDDVLVFDKIKFQRFVSNKAFLPDSYTAFKNKIGLTVEGSYLTDSKEVVLAWPYKDCVLEGGQTKEDAKRNEVFWNETLAPDQIDRLLAPKVLTNFKKYDKDGEHKITSISRADNLIIKGNNLLALHTLKKAYAGQVKLIYIDPPYNTGSDGFGYNDSFNHSTWLTFMRNRLEIAHQLLTQDGSMWMNIDDGEAHYLKVLSDSIFGRENFVANVVWQKRTSPDARINLGDAHDSILIFAKQRPQFINSSNALTIDPESSSYKNPDNDPRGVWASSDFTAQGFRPNQMYEITTPSGKKYSPPPGRCWKNIEPVFLKLVEDNRVWFGKNGEGIPRRKTFLSENEGLNSWTWWPNSEVGHNQEAKKEQIALFDAETAFQTPKPERLLKRIIQIATAENDLVLDFHLGSGTTAAVAHKMGRRYIGVEQMDYIESIPLQRLQKVIAGEQGGISTAVKWQDGGSFIYCELARANQAIIEQIQRAVSSESLALIWQTMQGKAFLSYRIDPKTIELSSADFTALSLDDQKRFLIEVMDKNMLYVPVSEIDDVTYGISEEDKKLNRQFFGKV